MPRFDTDSELDFTFTITFFAASQQEADTQAALTIARFFGNALAGILDLQSTNSTPLSGQDIAGANYTYTYKLDVKMGAADAATPQYNTLSAATAADALNQLKQNAVRVSNQNNMPVKINYLKASS